MTTAEEILELAIKQFGEAIADLHDFDRAERAAVVVFALEMFERVPVEEGPRDNSRSEGSW